MQINNIKITSDKCIKPQRFASFKGINNSPSDKGRVRYKHYEELSDDVLSARSIIKAHQDVQNSGKVRLYKALPAMATGIVAASLAITRPGRLSDKTVTGLGFLATIAGIDALGDVIFPQGKNTNKKRVFAALGALSATAIGVTALVKGAGNSEKFKKVTGFISKEASQLANEINKTKLSQLSNEYVEPFIQKHPKLSFMTPFITVVSTSFIGAFASLGLLKGISADISKKACQNFKNAKTIQQIARDHFDSVDAKEV